MMVALGAGVATEGAISVATGTAVTICGVSDEPVIDVRGKVAAYCDSTDHWLPLVRDTAAVACARQVRNHYGWQEEQMEGALAIAEPGAVGLLFHHHFFECDHGISHLLGVGTGTHLQVNIGRRNI